MCFVATFEDFAEVRARVQAGFNKMPPQYQRLRDTVFNLKLGCFVQQPFALGEVINPKWRATALVSMGNTHETIYAFHASRQSTNGIVAGMTFIERKWAHMMFDQWKHFFKNPFMLGQTLQKNTCNRDTSDVVPGAADAPRIRIQKSGYGLAHIMAEYSQAHD